MKDAEQALFFHRRHHLQDLEIEGFADYGGDLERLFDFVINRDQPLPDDFLYRVWYLNPRYFRLGEEARTFGKKNSLLGHQCQGLFHE